MAEKTLIKGNATRWRQWARPLTRQFGLFFPDWIVTPNLGFGRVQTINVDYLGLSNLSEIVIKKKAVVDVLLTQECCLTKRIDLPAAATAHASAVVDVFLRQSLPVGGQGMQWRTGPITQRGEAKSIVAYVLKDSLLEKLSVHIRSNGGRLRKIGLQEDVPITPFIDHSTQINRPARLWVGFAVVAYFCVCGFLIANRYQSVIELEKQVEALQEKRTLVAEEATVLTTAQQSQVAEVEARGEDLAVIESKSNRSRILEKLTTLVPTEIWFSEFSLIGNELRVSGYTKTDVVELISALQAADWIKRARLDGPMIQTGFDEGDRFELLIDLESQS